MFPYFFGTNIKNSAHTLHNLIKSCLIKCREYAENRLDLRITWNVLNRINV